MYRSVYDFKTFYNTPVGQTVRRVLLSRIHALWPDVHGLRVMGCGYAIPYLDEPFLNNVERVIAMMPATHGADFWGRNEGKNLVFLSDESAMPIENASIDRALLVHHLEGCEHLSQTLREIWRVLKPNGRLLVIVPNRTGLWSRAEWSPFGHGRPFTMSQLCFSLRDSLFVQERTMGALYVPPIRLSMAMRSAGAIEYLGKSMIPLVSGVHIVEASKQLYAGVDKTGSGSAVLAKTRELFGGRPVAIPRGEGVISRVFPEGYQD